jgi:hypothetical protein
MRVITANGDDLTETDDHMKVAMRQIAGAFSQLEKARLVAKLKAARDRKREANGKCEGRKSYAEGMPETVALASRLVLRCRCARLRCCIGWTNDTHMEMLVVSPPWADLG